MLNKSNKSFAERAEDLLSVMANAKRLEIIGYLLAQEMSVGEMAKLVSLSQSALSQHLAKLRMLDVVSTRRNRQSVYYSCHSLHVRQLYGALQTIFP